MSSGDTSILASDIFAAINQSTASSFTDAISQSLERANISTDKQVAAFGTALADFAKQASTLHDSDQAYQHTLSVNSASKVLSAAASAGLLARFDDIFLQVGMLSLMIFTLFVQTSVASAQTINMC